jgi:hypothetical protein
MALPSDVRKVFDLPETLSTFLGYALVNTEVNEGA